MFKKRITVYLEDEVVKEVKDQSKKNRRNTSDQIAHLIMKNKEVKSIEQSQD